MKLYEEHQKQEAKPINRPVSSYHHHHNVQQQHDNIAGSETKPKNKPQSAQTSSHHSQQSQSQKKNEPEKTFDQLINELNEFIMKNKITHSQFSDNDNVYLSFDDFKQIMHNIHYTISSSYMKILFNNNNNDNNNSEDDFLYLKLFIKNLKFYKSDEGIHVHGDTDSNFNNTSDMHNKSSISNSNSISNSKQQKKTKYYIDSNNTKHQQHNDKQNAMAYLNEEFSQFNKDINAILLNDKLNERRQPQQQRIQTAKPSYSKSSIHNIPQPKKVYSHNPNGIFPSKSLNESSTISKHTQHSEEQSSDKEHKVNKILFKDHALEQKKLDEKIQRICDKLERNKDNQAIQENEEYTKVIKEEEEKYKKLIKEKEKEKEKYLKEYYKKYDVGFNPEKIVRCYEIDPIKTKKTFQEIMDKKWEVKKKKKDPIEFEKYLQEEEEKEKYPSITKKAFHVQWRIQNKKYIHDKEMAWIHNPSINKELNNNNDNNDKDNCCNDKNGDRKGEMNKEIKEVLIETVRLKTKLKMQLQNLQKKVNISKDVVIEHLIKAGVNVPEMAKEEEKKENEEDENDKENTKKEDKKTLVRDEMALKWERE